MWGILQKKEDERCIFQKWLVADQTTEGVNSRPMSKILDNIQNSFSKLEEHVWKSLQEEHQEAMSQLLTELDSALKEERDKKRYVLKGIREREIMTRIGPVRISRSYYKDRETGEWAFLLDEYLGIEARCRVTSSVREDAVTKAVSGHSYRKAAAEMENMPAGGSISHEAIRQWTLKTGEVLEQQEECAARQMEGNKRVPVLFIEADGFWPAMQRANKQEQRFAVVHEGWKPRTRNNKEYALVNRRDIVPPKGKDFWEHVSAVVESEYDLSDTWVVINGDRARWIRKGVEAFPQALYQADRFHLLREVRANLRRESELLTKAMTAIYDSQPADLIRVLNEAIPKVDPRQKLKVQGLVKDIASYPEMARDYRVRLKEKGLELEDYRGLGAAEASVSRLSSRLRRLGRSWSKRGLKAMAYALAAHYRGTLRTAVRNMEQKAGLEKLSRTSRRTKRTATNSSLKDCNIPILHRGRGASGGMSMLMRKLSRGTLQPRLI